MILLRIVDSILLLWRMLVASFPYDISVEFGFHRMRWDDARDACLSVNALLCFSCRMPLRKHSIFVAIALACWCWSFYCTFDRLFLGSRGVIKYLCFHFGVFLFTHTETHTHRKKQNKMPKIDLLSNVLISWATTMLYSLFLCRSLSHDFLSKICYLSFRFRVDARHYIIIHTPTNSAYINTHRSTRAHFAKQFIVSLCLSPAA